MADSADSPDAYASLLPFGWQARWGALLAEHEDAEPGRVVRHDGVGLLVATTDGVIALPLTHRLRPAPTVGDWIAMRTGEAVAVLPRQSLLRRHIAETNTEQALAANLDVVLIVCGLDRPVKQGRIERSITLAWDAGATPVVVLTKADLVADVEVIAAEIEAENPGVDVVTTSSIDDVGLDAVRAIVDGRTVVMLGESGAGKSSLVNALIGSDVAATGRVREGDSKGRHTTTSRELHLIPSGGVLIDSPGIRAVGLIADADAVDDAFDDVIKIALACRFTNCGHTNEPGCAVLEAVEVGDLPAERVEAWRTVEREAAAATRRANPHEERRYGKQFARITKDAQKRKGRS